MKTMKRCVAIALAAVMMMLMMTGCGGTADGSVSNRYPTIVAKINEARTYNGRTKVTEYASLDSVAEKGLNIYVQYLNNEISYAALQNRWDKEVLTGTAITGLQVVEPYYIGTRGISASDYNNATWNWKSDYYIGNVSYKYAGIAVRSIGTKVYICVVFAIDA